MNILLSIFFSMSIFTTGVSTELRPLYNTCPKSMTMNKNIDVSSNMNIPNIPKKADLSSLYIITGCCNVANGINSGLLFMSGLWTGNPFCITAGLIAFSGSCVATAVLAGSLVQDYKNN